MGTGSSPGNAQFLAASLTYSFLRPCLPPFFQGKQIALLSGKLHIFISWNGGLSFFPKPRRRTYARAEPVLMSLLLLTCSTLTDISACLSLTLPLCLSWLWSSIAVPCFFAVWLNFCPLLCACLQHLCLWHEGQCNIYFWCVPGYTNLQKYLVQ